MTTSSTLANWFVSSNARFVLCTESGEFEVISAAQASAVGSSSALGTTLLTLCASQTFCQPSEVIYACGCSQSETTGSIRCLDGLSEQ